MIEFPQLPETLQWLSQVDTWGLPLAGAFLDQPHRFMLDLEVARRTRQEYRSKMAGESFTKLPDVDNFDALFADAPKHTPLAGTG